MTTAATKGHDRRIRSVPIGSITRHPDNARTHDIDVIMQSLTEHEQYAPIIVQRSTGYVIVGNGRHEAAERLGWKRIDVVYRDWDDDKAKRVLLMDNRASDLGGYDEAGLTALLASLDGDLKGTGYDDGDLDARLAELSINDPNEMPAASEELDGWERKDARTVILTFTVAEHARLCDKLDLLADRFDLDTYSAVVTRLVDDATD